MCSEAHITFFALPFLLDLLFSGHSFIWLIYHLLISTMNILDKLKYQVGSPQPRLLSLRTLHYLLHGQYDAEWICANHRIIAVKTSRPWYCTPCWELVQLDILFVLHFIL